MEKRKPSKPDPNARLTVEKAKNPDFTSALDFQELLNPKRADYIASVLSFPPDLIHKDASIIDYPLPERIQGKVEFRRPQDIYLTISEPLDKTTPMHELEHSIQLKSGTRYNPDLIPEERYTASVFGEALKVGLDPSMMIAAGRKLTTSTKLRDHLEKLLGEPVVYLGRYRDKQDDGTVVETPSAYRGIPEQFAELHAVESVLKKDLTKDPVVRREFFQDNQKFIDVYKATTGLRQDRLDAKDLPPMTVPTSSSAPKEPGVLDQVLTRVMELFK